MSYGFGVDLGGTTVKLACFESNGRCVHKWEIPTNKEKNGSRILPDIAAALLGYISENNYKKEDFFGIGIGVPGPVDGKGIVKGCINLGWGDIDIPAELGSLTGIPVAAGNDANMAALGECSHGAGSENMIFITLGTGVGGGMVIDGKVLPGVHGAGGEIGHICLNDKETIPCNCGHFGCAEQYLSATGVVRLAKEALAKPHEPSCLDSPSPITCKDVFDGAQAGDRLSLSVMDSYFGYMGRYLGILCCATDPEVVVFGGGVSKAGALLLEGAEKAFRKHAFGPTIHARFSIAKLGNDAGIYGAFHLAKQSFYK